MFYKQFLEIINVIDEQIITDFDFWLGTLSDNKIHRITESLIASKLGATHAVASSVIKFAFDSKILEKEYVIVCPNDECELYFDTVEAEQLLQMMNTTQYCHNCGNEFTVTPDCIILAYKRIAKPNVPDEIIQKEILKRIGTNESAVDTQNFTKADFLGKGELYRLYYNPNESAYNEYVQMRKDLDKDYGKDTTAKGKALEKLILKIFNEIQFVKGSTEIHTGTNQFDCTIMCGLNTCFPSIFNYLSPYFIIECKNEDEKPGNTYFNKLIGIMESNEAQIGIVSARKKASKTCFTLAREQYLINMRQAKKRILLEFSDYDLYYLVDNRINLLEYLEFKMFKVTTNSQTATWEMFLKEQG